MNSQGVKGNCRRVVETNPGKDPSSRRRRRNLKRILLLPTVMSLFLISARSFGAFVETGGLIVMEAENFETSVARSGHVWMATNNVAGFVGTAAMRAVPNTNTVLNSITNSPELTYSIQIATPGTFQLWVRAWGASGSDDSVYLGVDRRPSSSVGFGQASVWVWKSVPFTLSNAGIHQVNLWMREDGAYVDRLLLARSSSYVPTGSGPPETRPVAATFRWASESGRIYVESGGVATLSEISAALPKAPLCLIDPVKRIWFLNASLVVSDGATLRLYGSAAGGDVNELRMRSDNSRADGSCSVLEADWGTLDLKGVKITSWDQLTGAPDNEYSTFQRACIRARSRLVGAALQSSTLKVVNSEIGYLGVNSSEDYGLTWQAVGAAPETSVSGFVSNSYVHHCVLGLASGYSSQIPWAGNTVVSSTLVGFDPSSGNTVQSNSYAAAFRWAPSSGRIYVTGPGSATLSEIKAVVPEAPLTLVDPANKIWYLGSHMFLENGARLRLYGPAIGGDVRELRLKSDRVRTAGAWVELRADWGWLDIQRTKITSWDNSLNGPNTVTNFGRAFIRARSKLDPDGQTARESRMDVIGSEICYLGHHATESYGLTWKVVDTTAVYIPRGSTKTLFDLVNVYGDILNSHIHHNFFGVYTYGHFGGRWATNEVDNNFAYGFDPHDDSDNLILEGNHVHHNGWHGIIASKRCDHGILRGNLSHDNGREPTNPHGHGIMLHRSCNDWLVENNQSYNNPDSGIAIFASDRVTIRNNTCRSNHNAGIRLSVGSENNRVDGNQIIGSGGNGLYLFEGNDPPELDEGETLLSGRCRQNVFTNNFINGYGREAAKVQNADSNLFVSNVFIGAATQLRFENATNNVVVNNILPTDAVCKLAGTVTNVPRKFTSTTFANQPRVMLQIDQSSTATFTDQNGAAFMSDQINLTTVATPTGSSATLSSVVVGTGLGLVRTRNLFSVPTTGTAQINVTTWNVGGGNNRTKAWTVRGSSATMQIRFRVGDMRSNVQYDIRRGGFRVGTARSDSQGYLTFTSSPGATTPVTFSVQ